MIVRKYLHWMRTAPADARAAATHALGRAYLFSDIDDRLRGEMEAAMVFVLNDSAPEVRFALADALAAGLEAPRRVILALAADRPEIAVRVLSRSPIFADVELVNVVAAAAEMYQVAVASRPRLSNAVTTAIAEFSGRPACMTSVRNEGAQIDESGLGRLVERFGDDPGMREALLQRPDLPQDIRRTLTEHPTAPRERVLARALEGHNARSTAAEASTVASAA
ncbi:MAG: DUF2336 domain-containing protein [Hyphomicrobiales bacterium]|nr:DUF2336 domain-containing protein [Hyphomicrobiales bacterium]